MGCENSKLWLGLGVGAAIGALVYHFARTDKARKLRNDVCCALHEIEEDAESMLVDAKVKAAKAGSTLAGKVADKAVGLKEKLDIIK